MMAIDNPVAPPPAAVPDPLRKPKLQERIARAARPKKWLIRYAVKALDAADTVLSSIPVAAVAAEIKEVVLNNLPD